MKQHPTRRQQYKYTYLSGPLGLFAIHIIKPDGTAEINYIHADHLGSWNTITDENGNLLQEQSFDAWGNRRDPATWMNYTTTFPDVVIDRGFTGHEHLDVFGLINMNGRVYDPVVARFLSPDPYIQAPGMPQNYNGYVYCLNNPLVYTDPSGEVFGIDDLIIIGLTITGAYLGGVATNEGELNPVKWNYKSASTYIGITTGALFGYVGGYGIAHPGTISLALGITTPAAGVYLVGNQSDWSFEWTTMAGGEGSIETNKPTSIEDIIRGSNSSIPV